MATQQATVEKAREQGRVDAAGDGGFGPPSRNACVSGYIDHMSDAEYYALTTAERLELAEAYADGFLAAWASRCICGPDHDCRSTGCDDECPAC